METSKRKYYFWSTFIAGLIGAWVALLIFLAIDSHIDRDDNFCQKDGCVQNWTSFDRKLFKLSNHGPEFLHDGKFYGAIVLVFAAAGLGIGHIRYKKSLKE